MCEPNKLKPARVLILAQTASHKVKHQDLSQCFEAKNEQWMLIIFQCHNCSGQKCCLLNICGLIELSVLFLLWGKVRKPREMFLRWWPLCHHSKTCETPADWRSPWSWWSREHRLFQCSMTNAIFPWVFPAWWQC